METDGARARNRKRRRVDALHRRVLNPVMRPLVGFLPGQALLETTGRTSGRPRHTPIGGRRTGTTFWFVSNHGAASNYVRNIQANPQVRLKLHRRWYDGVATLVPDDDARRRLRSLPWHNSSMVRMLGTDLLSVRIDDLQPATARRAAAPDM